MGLSVPVIPQAVPSGRGQASSPRETPEQGGRWERAGLEEATPQEQRAQRAPGQPCLPELALGSAQTQRGPHNPGSAMGAPQQGEGQSLGNVRA